MSLYITSGQITLFEQMLKNASKILLISHTNPDGDAVGSVTAMCNYLKNKKIDSTIVLPDPYPDYLSFLDKHQDILIFNKERGKVIEMTDSADLIIALDFNQLQRVNELEEHILDSGAKRVLIDHHPSPQAEPFHLVISNTAVSSTSELLYWLMVSLEKPDTTTEQRVALPLEVAESLYVGVMTDTNNFSNSVTGDTFLMASALLSAGVDKDMLQNRVFGGFTESRMRLLGHMLLNKMVIVTEFGAGYITLSIDEQKRYNFSEGDSEGFVNLPLNIKGVNISALFTQKEDHIRVSLRSVNNFSVNRLSRLHFNGAGHERAAGGRLYIPFEEAGDYFVSALKQSFRECNSNELE